MNVCNAGCCISIQSWGSVDAGVLYISARDLLGRSPYGLFSGPRRAPDDHTLIIVSDIAKMIAVIALTEADRPQASHPVYTAELHATLSSRDEVIRLLEQIPPTEDPFLTFSEDVMRLIGSETAMQLYQGAGEIRSSILLTAASSEPDVGRAISYLDQAYDAFLTVLHSRILLGWSALRRLIHENTTSSFPSVFFKFHVLPP